MTEDQLGKRMYMISLNEVKFREIISKASQYGAGMELDKSNNWLVLNGYGEAASRLRATRRPKPPSLKEQALEALEVIPKLVGFESERDTIRAALEALPND
jgi:hypothetical protein